MAAGRPELPPTPVGAGPERQPWRSALAYGMPLACPMRHRTAAAGIPMSLMHLHRKPPPSPAMACPVHVRCACMWVMANAYAWQSTTHGRPAPASEQLPLIGCNQALRRAHAARACWGGQLRPIPILVSTAPSPHPVMPGRCRVRGVGTGAARLPTSQACRSAGMPFPRPALPWWSQPGRAVARCTARRPCPRARLWSTWMRQSITGRRQVGSRDGLGGWPVG